MDEQAQNVPARPESAFGPGDRLFETLIEAIPVPIFYKDRQGRYLGLNSEYEKFVGRPREEIIGRTVWDMWATEYAAIYDRADKELFERGQQIYETQLRHGDGSQRDVVLHKAVIGPEGQPAEGLVGVFLDVTAQKEAERQLTRLAETDQLTGLANRARFYEVLMTACARARTSGTDVGVLLIDLDGFKAINDTHGHEVGDSLLREIANRMVACVRETDTVARLGGDEFVIAIEDVRSAAVLNSIAGRLVEKVTQPVPLEQGVAEVGLSIGISIGPTDTDEAKILIGRADRAMYQAKTVDGSCFWYHGKPDPGPLPAGALY